MKFSRYTLILLFMVFRHTMSFATPQIQDKLIYNGDTLFVSLYLPNHFYESDTLSVDLFGGRKTCEITNCGRGYVAYWEIIDNQLYLTNIFSCCFYKDSIQANLRELFNGKVENNKVKAEWVTTKAFFQRGERIARIDSYLSIYKNDFEFEFNKGKLVDFKKYDNSKSKISTFSHDKDSIDSFIYTHINWNKIPKLNEPIKVIVKFSANEKGKVDKVDIVRGAGQNQAFDKEVIRTLKQIHDWDVFFLKGRHLRLPWTYPITISEEKRIEYMKKMPNR